MAKTKGTTTEGTTTNPTGTLVWNEARDFALVSAVSSGANKAADVAAELAKDPLFSGTVVTPIKVQGRCGKLRKLGVKIPRFGRGPGAGYKPDTSTLNALFG